MDEHELDICWAALVVAILSKRPKTSERAFAALERAHIPQEQIEAETLQMISLAADGYTYRQVGELYGLSKGAVHKRISRFKISEKAQNSV